MWSGQSPCNWFKFLRLAEPLRSGEALALPELQTKDSGPSTWAGIPCSYKINELDQYISAWMELKNMMLEGGNP